MKQESNPTSPSLSWQDRLKWMCAARACFLSITLLAVTAKLFIYGDNEFDHFDYFTLYKPIAILFGVTAITTWLNTTGRFQRALSLISILVDSFIISGVIFFSGGPSSPLYFLLVVYCLGIAISWGRTPALIWSAVISSAVLTFNILILSDGFTTPPGFDIKSASYGGIVLHSVGLLSAMVLVAIATSFLVRRVNKSYAMVEKSRRDLNQLREEHKNLESKLALQERMTALLTAADDITSGEHGVFRDFIGESELMQGIFRLITRAAATDATILVSGESGTGKELVARALHAASGRASAPFIAVNCGAIPESLIESELFGHKKGSFTGASSDQIGLFRQANGGTIFLDEIGELPASMQVKLLRVLQEQSVRPVGSPTDLPINVRVIAATNRNLKREVKEGRFREDLFYRINVLNIHLPPLRERRGDIPVLVSAFIRRLSKDKSTVPHVSPTALELLTRYDYPGNVRELENILERALVLAHDFITPEDLPEHIRGSQVERQDTEILCFDDITLPVDLDQLLASLEKRYLELALKKTGGAKKRAAELLGINFRSFRYRLGKFKELSEYNEG